MIVSFMVEFVSPDANASPEKIRVCAVRVPLLRFVNDTDKNRRERADAFSDTRFDQVLVHGRSLVGFWRGKNGKSGWRRGRRGKLRLQFLQAHSRFVSNRTLGARDFLVKASRLFEFAL